MTIHHEPVVDPIDTAPGAPEPADPPAAPHAAAPASFAGAFAFDEPAPKRRRRRSIAVVGAVAAVALVSGAVLGVQASSADPLGQLRTATVQTRSVRQTIDTVATVEPVSQASVAFPVSGTVASVVVTAGAVVTAGQTLATLDTTALRATVNERQADLASAQLALQQAANGESVTGSGSAASGASSAATGGSSTAAAPSASSSTATGSTASSATASTSASASTSTAATSYQLAARQKAVDAAEVQLQAAEQTLEQATIVSPLDGTVVAVDLAVGDAVTAGSATAAIIVAGAGGYELTTTVSVTDLPDLEVGQAVVIRPDAGSTELDGTVVAIGVAPSASSTTSYPVTIGINGNTTGLRNGSTASISIVTDDVADAVSVPASAVTADGDRRTVTVVDAAGQTTDVSVEVGAVGGAWIAVTKGLDVGQTVVLADLDDPLPGSATDTSSVSTNRGGAGGTGGPPSGAFTGGPPAGMGARPGG